MRKRIFSVGLLSAIAAVIAFSCILPGMAAHAVGTSSAAPQTAKNFKQVCGQARRGYAHCLAFMSTSTISAPPSQGIGANALQPDADNAPGTTAPYSPMALHNAYNLPTQAQSAQTVAIVDANDDPNAESDMNTYRARFGIPACTTANGCFSKIDEHGGTSYPTADSGWAQEISLDLDMVSAICQNCHIMLVEASSSNFDDLGLAVNTAASLGATEISNSYGGSQTSTDANVCDEYYTHPGVAVTVSSGDDGPAVESPADCSNVVAVGGTTLNSNGTETAWSTSSTEGAGGGCSSYTSIPSWENSSVTGCQNRAVSDVSAVADPNTGVYVYDTYQANGWYQFGGTSASSPIIASVYALAGGVTGEAASIPWNNYTNGCLSKIQNTTYAFQTGLGSPDGIDCF